ncbi:hypothetical protein PV327_010778 [Microctonus hyperodae]|uniref:Uncharacterized protein n=1 Tax=Microctonus hyperodae TaxID=165561 RepID=A0AA39C8I4_MICHY|nr:hypothetical protein PV327_010778 [Microctonus hyperodae]
MCIRLIIFAKKSVYDDIIVSYNFIINNKTNVVTSKKIAAVRLNKSGIDADLASVYIKIMKTSCAYCQNAIKLLEILLKNHDISDDCQSAIFLRLKMPKKPFLDYRWSERMNLMAMERREIDYAMSWLSTLGGAFSAMGEQFNYCAKIAGEISIKQFELALRLGDPLLVARCQLYASLSLIQQEKFKIPRKLIPKIFKYANKSENKQLARMCLGIWAKLKYTVQLKRQKINQHNYISIYNK